MFFFCPADIWLTYFAPGKYWNSHQCPIPIVFTLDSRFTECVKIQIGPCHSHHCFVLNCTAFYWNEFHCTAQYFIKNVLHCTPLHFFALGYTALHYSALSCIGLQYPSLNCTALYCTLLHYITFHFIILHYTYYKYFSCQSQCWVFSTQ